MDYEDLLRNYIHFVSCVEGYNFLSDVEVGDDFTEEEFNELLRLAQEGG